jgi:hypothetical protein
MIQTLKIGNLTLGTLSSGYLFSSLAGFGCPSLKVDIKEKGSTHGADLGVHLYGRRVFEIELEILGTDKEDYETKRRALEQACDIYDGTTTLTILTKSGLELISTVIATAQFDLPYKKGAMVFSDARLELTAPYPFLRSKVIKNRIITMWSGGGFGIPFAIPMDMSAGASATHVLDNVGNAIGFPTIVLNGALEDPTIVNITTGEQMSFDYALTNGNYISIDVVNRVVLLNGVTNIRQYVSGDWISLIPGDNYVKLTATSFDSDGNAVFNFRDSYIGI